ncbi:zona pellucida sperm-binding protein 4-like [Synchiropus splendidus]|uniref:zona pellucida sperm-binding protein 4-like n=1 Tax=Synchiropus splendidus TaxID=270530 RepID=UPI00237E3AC1|nr:zona pellucida sperm-binding protein 4-like [Synchiropus splendidus]
MNLFDGRSRGFSSDSSGAVVPVAQTDGSCGVKLDPQKNQSLVLYSTYDSCYAHLEGSQVVVPLQVQLQDNSRWFRVNISCPRTRRSTMRSRPLPIRTSGECTIQKALRLECGHPQISSTSCNKLGCCFDSDSSSCYYRLNACSPDGHIVFSLRSDETQPPVDLKSLSVKNEPDCIPAIIAADTAVFKVQVMDCGVQMKVSGDVVSYSVEVEEQLGDNDYEDTPFSVRVQCEYETTELMRAADLRSFQTVTNPPPAVALGNIRVQMRLATDSTFTSFHPEDQLPLALPLREPAYVEVSIAQPSLDPSLSLHVRNCFAYPVSRHSIWTLLYDGCPNPLDDMRSSVPVDHLGQTSSHSQVRRFDVKTFAFLDPEGGHPRAETMFFYCWVQICSQDMDCSQDCSIVSADGERRRRATLSQSNLTQWVSFGPLLPTQDDQEQESCSHAQNSVFQVMLYAVSAVGTVLVLIMMLLVFWTRIRWCKVGSQPDPLEGGGDCK